MPTPVNDVLVAFIRQALIDHDRDILEGDTVAGAAGDFVRRVRQFMARAERAQREEISSQEWAALAEIIKNPPPVPDWLKKEVQKSPGGRELDRQIMRETFKDALAPITPLLRANPKTLDEARDHIDGLIAEISDAIGALHTGAYRLGIDLNEGHELDKYPQIEGCTECEWRGTYDELIEQGGHDQCPDCGAEGTMTTYYGPDELREGEILGG